MRMQGQSISRLLLAGIVFAALFQLPLATDARESLSKGQSPMSNFKSHAENKCPNEWSDYQKDKRTLAEPIQSDPPGLRTGAPSGTNSKTFDDGQGVQAKSMGIMIKQKCTDDQAGPAQQCALSVPLGGPRPVTSSSPDMVKTDYTQPFIRPAQMTGSEAPRTTLDCRLRRNAAPLGSAAAPGAPASNAQQSGSQLWANLPLTSNGASAVMMSAFGDQFLSAATNPAANALKAKADQQIKNMQNADNQGISAQENTQTSIDSMTQALINVANEDAAAAVSSDAAYKEESNVIWMVQQMYKKCYVPMAVLFLLPGAVLTQLKSTVAISILGMGNSSTYEDDDSKSPFSGIIRSIVAIFLIPATQLTVSYCIDIGNALTDPVAQQVKKQEETLMNWVKEQAYASNPSNQDNHIRNLDAGQLQGKLMGTPSSSVVQERQSDLTVTVQNTLNTINAMMSQGLNILNGFQLVMICYLFLLGPIAASLFAWPASVGSGLFKRAFSSWLDAVIVLSLWKFWWCIVLLCMAVRLAHGVDPTSQYEMYYYTSFMAILVMVPFQPFDFRPGDIVSQVLEKTQSGSGGSGSSSGGSSGASKSSGGSGGSSRAASAGQNGNMTAGAEASMQNMASSRNSASNPNSAGSGSGAAGSQNPQQGNGSAGGSSQARAGSGGAGSPGNEQPVANKSFDVVMNDVKQPPRSEG